ncbi:MAG: helix-turn-helix transcriptional regulator [Actinomycetota bacterium]|nr:helix-turn-helix transcriptional regulator [Actinomycetota bacterium]
MTTLRSRAPWKGMPTLLRDARERAGITTVEAAEALDVRRPAISEIEHGKRRVSAEELGKLADLYGVSVTWLLERASSAARDDRAELAAQVLAGMSDAQLDRLTAAIRIVRERRSPGLNMPGARKNR